MGSDQAVELTELLGRTVTLYVQRLGAPGAFCSLSREAKPSDPSVLLPRNELDEYVHEGDALEAFVYLDSEDRPVATLAEPKLELGQVAFLEVRDVNRFGAFVDWGLPKQLLVPFKEQIRELAPGDWEPIALDVDRTGRLVGTMRVREFLEDGGAFERNEWVPGEAWRFEPAIGLFVIIERRYVGLLPAHERHGLKRGEQAQFRVSHVQPDGKVELSLRGLGHEERASDGEKILAKLRAGKAPGLSDRTSPEEIDALFGLSKKAFKRAMGGLLKEGSVTFDRDGCFVVREKK
ncbi:MAG: S1-like domain-containing RNA-binding protein [Myxococcales bacterium]